MRFIVIGKDGTDGGALDRRLKAREAHLALGDIMLEAGELLNATALLNDAGNMCGSVMLVEFSTRHKLEEWLEKEPYVRGGVWKDIEVFEAKVGPSFEQFLPS